jgi:hypothetical protein
MPRHARSSAGASGRAFGESVVVAMPTTIEPSGCMHNDMSSGCEPRSRRRSNVLTDGTEGLHHVAAITGADHEATPRRRRALVTAR